MADKDFTAKPTDQTIRKRQPNGSLLKFVLENVMPSETSECIIWPFGKNAQGYGQMRYKGKQSRPHRVVCQLAHGDPVSDDLEAAHSCGNRLCVNPAHLSWKTHATNELDKVAHGTIVRGESSNFAKLTESQVLEIKKLGGSMPQAKLARMFGIGQQQVSRILSGKRWAWLG